jgi:hypothetical protein
MLHGFIDNEHQEAFEAARADHRRGGALAKCCEARTRGSGTCKQPPLKNHTRCLRHAGPHAARRHRDNQLRELALGRLDPAVFAKSEIRRAANRIRDTWKNNAWIEGSTIDLGTHENAFRSALAAFGWRPNDMPPAVVDWVRWRFRRLMVDRQRPDQWAEIGRELLARIDAAGAPPDEPREVGDAGAVFSTPDRLAAYSRRRVLDPKRTRKRWDGRQDNIAVSVAAKDAEALGAFLDKHRTELGPVLALCEGETDMLTVAAAFKHLLDAPGSKAAQRAWMDTLRRLGS